MTSIVIGCTYRGRREIRMAIQEVESVPGEECEVCGREVCECPPPLGECDECRVPIYEGDRWAVDSEGGRWCLKCWPGGEA